MISVTRTCAEKLSTSHEFIVVQVKTLSEEHLLKFSEFFCKTKSKLKIKLNFGVLIPILQLNCK